MAEYQKAHALIVGGGLAGVATAIALARHGHKVTLLEGGSEFTEVGAGIQVPPNCSRILTHWGLIDEFNQFATNPHVIRLCSYKDGKVLAKTALVTEEEDQTKYPHLVLQRGDYLRILVREARRLGAELLPGNLVEHIDFETPSVRTISGKNINADFIIGADGQRSLCRSLLLGRDDPPIHTGNIVYRFTIQSDVVRQYDELKHLVSPASVVFWLGPRSHAVCYELTHRKVLNVVLVQPKVEGTSATTLQNASLSDLRMLFSAWDPKLRRLLDLAESCKSWPLINFEATSTWTHPSGKVLLTGDAAHYMTPHLVQGASQAIEDAACLGALMSRLRSKEQISDLIKIFCDLRKPRVAEIASKSKQLGELWHIEDGPLQVERDRQFELSEDSPDSLNPFSNEMLLRMLYGYNVIEDSAVALERYERGE